MPRFVALAALAAVSLAACTRLTRAQQIVSDAANALGGRDRVLAARTLVIEGAGTQYNLGQDVVPGASGQTFTVTNYRRAIDLAGGRGRIALTRTPDFAYFQGPAPQKQTQGLDGAVGYNIAPNGTAVRIPDEVSWRQGALVEPLAVGLHAVRGSQRGLSGKNVLVIGAGPIGLAVSLWCRLFGARQVVVSELEPGRREMAMKYGATATIDARLNLPEQFLDLAGAAPDVIFECVGVPGMIAHAVDVAPPGAELVIVGFCMDPDTFMPAAAMAKELSMQFVVGHDKSDFQLVVDMLAGGRLDVDDMITDVYSFDQFSSGFEALRKPTHQCKILLDPTLM